MDAPSPTAQPERQQPSFTPNKVPNPPRAWIHQQIHPDPTAGGILRWEPFGNKHTPFYDTLWENKQVFERGEWLGNANLSDAQRDEYFRQMHSGIPWRSVRGFNADVDRLPHGPDWVIRTVPRRDGQLIDVYCRDPVECVDQLIGTRHFSKVMQYAPERWQTGCSGERLFGEMSAGEWWWRIQSLLGYGRCATIAPIILSSDKTQMSPLSGDKAAWPIYITIGNIDKSICRKPSEHATMLLGYVPVTDLESEEGWQFFHDCVRAMLSSLHKGEVLK